MRDHGPGLKATSPSLEAAGSIWDAVKAALRQEIGEHNYRSWIAPMMVQTMSGGVLELSAPSRLTRDWVRTHYADRIRAVWGQMESPLLRLDIVSVAARSAAGAPVAETSAISLSLPANDALDTPEDVLSAPLDARCTFESFVVGASNELAVVAARRMSEKTPAPFNPLYIQGEVGLGKTHLLQAIAAAARAQRSNARVVYMSAERFMFCFVQSLRNKDTMTFKAACRAIDMLLIDDLQFVCGKEATQDELLSVLDALLAEGKHVVVAADRPPHELEAVGDRLRSRLSGGLVAQIWSPDFNLRLAILRQKTMQLKRDVPDAVLELLAQEIQTSVRALEGVLNRLIAHAEFMHQAICVETAQGILKDVLKGVRKVPTILQIQKCITAHYGVRLDDLLSARRARSIVWPRQVAMYFCKVLTPASLPEMGRQFGGRDHTTILHGIRKVEEKLAQDSALRSEIEALRREILG